VSDKVRKKVQKTEIGLVSPSYTCTIHGIKKAEAETSALFALKYKPTSTYTQK
jgi:hypothetical protein